MSDKVGNRYEDRWTVRCVFDVLDDEADAIRLEPPGTDDDGVEFWVRFGDRLEYHQCKRQRTRDGHWSIAALTAAKVLSTFKDKLSDTTAKCVFVSTHAADALDELAERARSSTSLEEFVATALKSQEWKAKFDALCRAWDGADEGEAFQALRRIYVRTIGEDELAAMNRLQAEVALAGDIDKSVPVLTDILRRHAGEFLAPKDLWPELKRVGYEPNPWRSTQRLASMIEAANRRFSTSREATLIGGSLIDRPEATRLHELVSSEPVVLVDGVAGAGKSDVLLQFVRDLEAECVPHLALRLDRVAPTVSPDRLGAELELPGSPVATLAGHAQGSMAVLIIDQLDIVSATSGRSPWFLECVTDIILAASTKSNIRIVLCCRSFDLHNDARLRRLVTAREQRPIVTVGRLTSDQVLATVKSFGPDSLRLTEAQISLLATPLHLALLCEIASSASVQPAAFEFSSVADLFESFWQHKRTEVADRLGHAPAWTEVLDALCDFMSERQVLQAPADLADQWEADLIAMTSCHVITRDGANVAFFHESFFDYVFARRFVGRGRKITELLTIDQDLFRRGQIRQILVYNRNRSDEYLADLRYLLTEENVRYHIRDMVTAWLAEIVPMHEEWEILRLHLDDQESALHLRAWRTLASVNWFKISDDCGYLESCLKTGDKKRIDHVLPVLVAGSNQFAERAVELLAPHLDGSSAWIGRFVWFVQQVGLGKSRTAFDILSELLTSGALLEAGLQGHDLWSLAQDLPSLQPGWACELMGRYLEERTSAGLEAEIQNPFDRNAGLIPERAGLHDYVCESAQGDPQAFLSEVWPQIKAVIDANLLDERDSCLRKDTIWQFRGLGFPQNLEDDLMSGCEVAFKEQAVKDPSEFRDLVLGMSTTTSEVVVSLIMEGFAANAVEFADEAVEALISRPKWIRVGWSYSAEWATRKLLEAVTPHVSETLLEQLESELLSLYPAWERTAEGRSARGYAQFTLLGGIDENRRSEAVSSRLGELRRKFGCHDVPPPKRIEFGIVEPPISSEATEKMSDQNWLTAIARYSGEEDRSGAKGPLSGGAHQLAFILEERAKEDPARFAHLATLIPDSADSRYFDAILRGVGASDIKISQTEAAFLVERCHALPGRPCGRWIARPLLGLADTALSEAMVEIVTWYATSDPDPALDVDGDGLDGDQLDERLLAAGLNSVRGGIAAEIVRLVWNNETNAVRLVAAITSLVRDRVAGVRACAAQIVVAVLTWNAENALAIFEELLSDCPEELLANRYVFQFLRYRIGVDLHRLRPVVERMLRSDLGEVQMNGSAVASLAVLSDPAAAELAQPCLTGTEMHRLGAARVYAANLTTSNRRDHCAGALIDFFNDDYQKVRDAAVGVIRDFSNGDLGEFEDVAQGFLDSAAAEENWDALLQALVDTSSAVPALALKTCQHALSSAWGNDLQAARSYRPDLVSEVLLRVYADGAGEVRSQALDLIDLSLRQNIYGVQRALAKHDRG